MNRGVTRQDAPAPVGRSSVRAGAFSAASSMTPSPKELGDQLIESTMEGHFTRQDDPASPVRTEPHPTSALSPGRHAF